MKRILCGAAALLLALLLCGQALAAASAEPVRIFVYEDTLYTYMELEGVDSPITQVEAKIEGQSFPATSRLETVRQAGFPITYLLLVDNSNSMPPFREQLNAFGRGLAENSGENTRFILATFGDEFQVISDSVPAEELEAQLAAIPLDEPVTRLHTCMNSALDYLEAMPRQGTELRSMVVITDGVQYDPLGAVPYEELLERISHSDVMLHSLGMGSDSEALASLGRSAAEDSSRRPPMPSKSEPSPMQPIPPTFFICLICRTISSTKLSSSSSLFQSRKKAPQKLIPITPPRSANLRTISSVRFRGWEATALALEWLATKGFLVCSNTSWIPLSFRWEISMIIPSRSISSKKAIPVSVSPCSVSGTTFPASGPSQMIWFGQPRRLG